MRIGWVFITLVLSLNIFINNSYCADIMPDNNSPNSQERKTIETILNSFLNCRMNLDFNCCSKYFSQSFLVRFAKENGRQYAEFNQTAETHYPEAQITRIDMVGDASAEALVESYSEEPGILSKDLENYKLKMSNGSWKIDDYSIVNYTIVKELGLDGKWKAVKPPK